MEPGALKNPTRPNFGQGDRSRSTPSVASAPVALTLAARAWLVLACALALLAGCGPARSSPTPPACPAPPAAESGALCGQVQGVDALWPDETVLVYAAPFTRGGSGGGFYMLEPMIHPHAELLPGGYFVLPAVSPGEYVLIFGPDPGEGRAWVDDAGQPRPVTVPAGQAVELGVVAVR